MLNSCAHLLSRANHAADIIGQITTHHVGISCIEGQEIEAVEEHLHQQAH